MTAPTITRGDHILAALFDEALDEPAPLRDFVVTVQPERCIAPIVTMVKARHAVEATTEALATAPDGSRVDVRPLIERTEYHGFSRWPAALHADAMMDAQRGWFLASQNPGKSWHDVQTQEGERRRERRALSLQMDRQDALSRACMGGAA